MDFTSRRAKIIATLGPSSQSPAQMRALLLSGMDVARFNFSHGGPLAHAPHVENLREVSREEGRTVAFLQDLQGPKIRTGNLADGQVELVPGRSFTLTTRPVPGDQHEVSTTYNALPRDCRVNDAILLDDGNLSLRVEATTDTDVKVRHRGRRDSQDEQGHQLAGRQRFGARAQRERSP